MTSTISRLLLISAVTCCGLLFAISSAQASSSLECNDLTGCERKLCEIQNQIDIAKAYGNEHKVNGLTKALTEVKEHCTDEALKDELMEDIADLNREITEYQADFKEAEANNDLDKQNKYQRKISEKQLKIEQLKQELSNLL